MAEFSFRPFQPRDAAQYGMPVADDAEIIGVTAERGGVVVGWGVVALDEDGQHWGFVDVLDYNLRRPVIMHRLARRFMAEMKADSLRVACDTSIKNAEKWLKRLNFNPTGEVLGGQEVWQWHR